MNFELQSFDLEKFENEWRVPFEGEFVRLNIIEQNLKGDVFAIASQGQEAGRFNIKVVDNTGSILDDLDVTDIIKCDQESLPIKGQNEPMITCCFIDNDDLFISVYHRINKI
jgi:hypothetical protein